MSYPAEGPPLIFPRPMAYSTTLEQDQEGAWNELQRFYKSNASAIEKAASKDVKSLENPSDINEVMDSFTETINVVLDGLVALGNVHPIVGVAVWAFHSVISLDLKRRDNNKKVLAVKLQMQNMMCAMFQLRSLTHAHVQGPEKKEQRGRLQSLIGAIAKDIRECGSDLNYYSDRKLLSKLIKAKLYENRFKENIENFKSKRAELQFIITAYIAAGVDHANIMIENVDEDVPQMREQLDVIFRNLNTPREQAALQYLEKNGGPVNCLTSDRLFDALLSKVGETLQERDSTTRQNLLAMRRSLITEFNESMETALSNNQARFEQLLAVQDSNMKSLSHMVLEHGLQLLESDKKLDKIVTTSLSVLEEGKIIRKALVANPSIKLKDPELGKIWSDMRLEKSVKAKRFVLTLRDHLYDHSARNTPRQAPKALPETPEQEGFLHTETNEEDWVLKYVDAVYARPIIEAIDEDMSGFISVKEANKFALSRPAGWSVLRWIAYWAAGWHISLTDYKDKIYSILHQMLKVTEGSHPLNRYFVDEYFNHEVMARVEGLARSIKALPQNVVDSKLTDLAKSVAELQEERLSTNLRDAAYVINSPADVTLIAGTGRVETWILPLLCILLSRHLQILKLAKTVILHSDELAIHNSSLVAIFNVFDDRQSHLEAIFRQKDQDLLVQFGNHSYGMFLASFQDDYSPARNRLSSYEHPSLSDPEGDEQIDDTSILHSGVGPDFRYEDLLASPSDPGDHGRHPLEGRWISICYSAAVPSEASRGPFVIDVEPITDNKLNGRGDSFAEIITCDGEIVSGGSDCSTPLEFLLKLRWPTFNFPEMICKGKYDHETDTIEGAWIVRRRSRYFWRRWTGAEGDAKLEDLLDEAVAKGDSFVPGCDFGRLYMTKRSDYLDTLRFRHSLESSDPSHNLARRRWAFALETVLFQTRRKMNSPTFWLTDIDERRKWMALNMHAQTHWLYDPSGYPWYLSGSESREWTQLVMTMHPSTSREIYTMSRYLSDRKVLVVDRVRCDACRKDIRRIQYLCIICIENDLSNGVDLCKACATKTESFAAQSKYVHHPSHTLVRFTRRFHDCLKAAFIPRAKRLSDNVKASFKDRENLKDPEIPEKEDLRAFQNTSNINLICASCKKALTLPCWACTTCGHDILICTDCDRKNQFFIKDDDSESHFGSSDDHSHLHPLLLITQTAEVNVNDSKPIRLDIELKNLEARINEGLSKLKQETTDRQDKLDRSIGSQIQDLARLEENFQKLEQKVDNMTALLQELLVAMNPSKVEAK